MTMLLRTRQKLFFRNSLGFVALHVRNVGCHHRLFDDAKAGISNKTRIL